MSIDNVNKNITILVVDDYALTRDMVKSILRQIGFTNVIGAEDGRFALDILSDTKVDLVICDWNMPHMSGLEVLQEIRSKPVHQSLPFLMLTAEAYRENVVEAMKAGVSDYIVKPFTAQTLSDKLAAVLIKTHPADPKAPKP